MSLDVFHQEPRVTLYRGDCVEVMRELEAASVDAIVTDPPYGLEFMGKEWDRLEPNRQRWAGTERETFAPGPRERGDNFAQRMAAYPGLGQKRNPHCRTCGHYRFSGSSGSPCSCVKPDFDLRSYGASQEAFHAAWAVEAFRVLKPGGHLLAFGGTRTFHRLTCALEDAGFEIRDCLAWLYGSGFPKSHDVSKAIDKAAGAERRRIAGGVGSSNTESLGTFKAGEAIDPEPITEDARTWQGWGTALKPAWEPIILARKPLIGSVVANVLEHGTGALNVDACRIAAEGASPSVALRRRAAELGRTVTSRTHREAEDDGRMEDRSSPEAYARPRPGEELGRWPANLVLDEQAAAALDEQSGETSSAQSVIKAGRPKFTGDTYNGGEVYREQADRAIGYLDAGGASRFFKVISWQEDDALPTSRANDAADHSIPSSRAGGSVGNHAPTASGPDAHPETPGPDCTEKSDPPIPRPSRASSAGTPDSTDTIPTTPTFCASCGSALHATGERTNQAERVEGAAVNVPAEAMRFRYDAKADADDRDGSSHPTVKPVALMKWLVRLVTPPGGLVLDPFLGSGTTAYAARELGFRVIGVERETTYLEDAVRRLRQGMLW